MSAIMEHQHCVSCGVKFEVTSDTGFNCSGCAKLPDISPSSDECREAFEAWCADHGFDPNWQKAQMAFRDFADGWQAALNTRTPTSEQPSREVVDEAGLTRLVTEVLYWEKNPQGTGNGIPLHRFAAEDVIAALRPYLRTPASPVMDTAQVQSASKLNVSSVMGVLDSNQTIEAVIKELKPHLKLFFRWAPEDFAEQVTMKVFANAAIRAIQAAIGGIMRLFGLRRYATAWEGQFGRVWVHVRFPRFWRTSGVGFIRIASEAATNDPPKHHPPDPLLRLRDKGRCPTDDRGRDLPA